MASVVGTYARAFADVVMKARNQLDSARALQELHSVDALLKESDQLRRVAEAQVSTARQLGDPEKQMLEAEIARLTGKKVRARYEQDASLLGGAVVQVGSTIYDGSVKGQLEKIREQLVS